MAPENFRVRPATKDDLIRIHEMDIESYGPQTTPITGLIWLVEKQGDKPILFLSVGAEVRRQAGTEGEQLIGFIAWKEIEGQGDIRSMEILHLVIGRHYRQEGMGEALMQGVLDQARDRGLRGASMHVPADHEGAVSLLKKLGFNEYQRVPGFFRERGDGLIFAKVLNYPV